MKILGIESSCDETAVAIVEDGRKVHTNIIASQIDLHAKTGGVVPEVAAREHVLKMLPVLDEAFAESGLEWDDIDAVAVTQGPGLVSSLIIGTQTASIISYLKGKPLIPVNHIMGHLYSNWLDLEGAIYFPIVILTVSGGHNELVLMRDHLDFDVLGETRDDASGEAFDKVARLLGMGYPGGPVIAKLAEKGDSARFDFPKIYLEKGSLDFSFSGLKTAVLTEVKEYAKANGADSSDDLDEQFKADVSASFQETACTVLSDKLMMALEQHPDVQEIHLAGGVSANIRLREMIQAKLPEGVIFRHPKSIRYCTDNAAMIAAAGYFLWQENPGIFKKSSNIIASSSFEL